MQVIITQNNQEDAGDDNFEQTYYYSEKTCNYLYIFLKQIIYRDCLTTC